MGRRQITEYYDDIDNTPLNKDEVHTVRFGVEGADYIMDLSADHAAEFHQVVQRYVTAARRDTQANRPRRRYSHNSAARSHTRQVREWASANGYQVADRGKIPQEIHQAYNEAHSS